MSTATDKPDARGQGNADVKRLTALYIVALSLVAFLSISGQVLIQWQLHRQLDDSRVINLAGRQRMLSQKICKEILVWKNQDDSLARKSLINQIGNTLKVWQTSHEALQHGDQELGLPGANSLQLTTMFAELQTHFQAMESAVEQLTQLAESQRSAVRDAEIETTIAAILDRESDYLSGMNDIVFQYDREAAQRVKRLRTIESALLVFTLMVLLAEGIFIFRPTTEKIRSAVTALESTSNQLLQAKQTAELANQQKSAFLANVSHDLRTPMNAIIGLTELAQTTADREQRQHYLQNLAESADSLLLLLNDLIDLSRIEASKIELRPSNINTARFFARIEGMLRPLAEAKQLDFQFKIQRSVPVCFIADELRLQQVLVNLLNNAIKFTEAGYVKLRVDLETLETPSQLQIEVSDTGVGIAPEDQCRVFESFTQLGGTAQKLNNGAGLGLAICSQLIQEFGGSLELQSQPEAGTTFSFSIPISPLTSEATELQNFSEIKTPDADHDLTGCKVLVVEDTVVNQLVVGEILRRAGCLPSVVGDGKSALDLIANQEFDVVLMDLQLPDWDGLEITRRIRKYETLAQRSSLPIIALTAHAMSDDRDRCLQAGMNAYLTKPIRTPALLATLTQVLLPTMTHDSNDLRESQREALNSSWSMSTAKPQILQRLDGREDVLAELINLCRTELPLGLAELEDATLNNELQLAARISHRLKGTLGNLAAERAVKLAARLERSCELPGNKESVRAALEAFKRELSEFLAELETVTVS